MERGAGARLILTLLYALPREFPRHQCFDMGEGPLEEDGSGEA